MNILEIVSGTRINGAILHCLLLSRELAQRGHRVTIACLPGSWMARQAREHGLDVVTSDLHRWPVDELRRMTAVVQQRQIDVVHTHTSRANFFGILLRWAAGVPSVATAHSRHIQLHWMFNDRVIAVSEANRRYHRLHNLVRGGRIETIHNFIDAGRLGEVPADARRRVRAWLGIGDHELLVGIVGNILPRKGLIHLVRALPQIAAAVPQVRLAVVGGDTQNEYAIFVRHTARELGVASHIRWTGHRGDVHEILAALDLYALPSLEESFPMSILEAMAAGLPVLATTAGGVAECVVDGQTGFLAAPGDSDGLARGAIALLADPLRRRRFGEAGRRRVHDCFSAASQVPRIEAALARVARRRMAA